MKRLFLVLAVNTRLKPGANETGWIRSENDRVVGPRVVAKLFVAAARVGSVAAMTSLIFFAGFFSGVLRGACNHRKIAFAALVCLFTGRVIAAEAPAFRAIGAESLDRAVFAQWVAGSESPIGEDVAKGGPLAVVWGAKSRPEFRGVKFGAGRETGVRHLRIGFREAVGAGMPERAVILRMQEFSRSAT